MSRKIIEGNYSIVVQKTDSTNLNSIITGKVYDKDTNVPIKDAVVQIKELKRGVFTDEEGQFYFEIAEYGSYEVEALNAGHTTLLTEHIEFTTQSKTIIIFHLGKVTEY